MTSTNLTSLTVNGVPVLGGLIPTVTGNVFWVDSGNPLATTVTPGTPNLPLSTIDSAINKCTANNGDLILVKEGHAETLTTAGAIALDIAGVTVLGIGSGDNRPVITFGSTDNTASITMAGNNTRLLNVVLVCNDDGLTAGLVVSGNNCVVDVETKDTSSAVEYETAVRLDTADNCTLNLKHLGFTAGNAVVRLVAIDDCDNVKINIDAYGVVSTAWVNMVDAASTNVLVKGTLFTQGVTNGSRDIVDTISGSTWFGAIDDMSAGKPYSGGSAQAWASSDVTGLAAAIDAIDNFVDTEVASILTASGAVGDAALVDTSEGAAGAVSLVSLIKGALQRIGADSANNTAATTSVSSNRDGSLLERTEAILSALLDDDVTNLIGYNDSNNNGESQNVVANRDGTIVERLEALMDPLAGYSSRLGFAVTKVGDLADGAGTDNLFTVTGRVLITSLTGEVTTVVGGAATLKLRDITNSVDLCAATTIDTDAVGTMYALTSISANILNGTGAVPVVGSIPNITGAQQLDVAVVGGAQAPITLAHVLDAADTGQVTWVLTYIPLTSGATVVSAA